MSRHGYVEDWGDWGDSAQWAMIRQAGALRSAIRGKRGQALLREMLESLDALPEKRLVEGQLQTPQGDVCAFGALGVRRGIDMGEISVKIAEAAEDGDDSIVCDMILSQFNVAAALAREIMYVNDDFQGTPEERFAGVRSWVAAQLV